MNKKGKKTNSPKFPKIEHVSAKEKYAQWLAFPSILRDLDSRQHEKLGLDVSDIEPFLMIKTKTEFAKVIRADRKTLYNWKQEPAFQKMVKDYIDQWGASRTPSMITALYRQGLIEGDAPRVKLWLQAFHQFTEKTENKHIVDLEAVEELTNVIKGFLKS